VKPEPMIRTESYDDCAISYTIEFFIDNYDKKLDVYDELKTRIWYAAKRYNLNMPFPIREIYQMPPASTENNTTLFTDHLKSIPSLARMEQESLQSIAKSAVLHHFAGGEKVIVEGDRVQALHLVIAGKARVTATNSKGKIEDLFTLGKGEFFGEMSLFTGEPSAVTITALEDLEVLLIYADTANTMIDRQPSLAREIGQVMEARRKAVNIARSN
ncbi:MAG TPA: cyclic nucleotide-binding domain-containing protein, partial [Allocoleopsis sp.]